MPRACALILLALSVTLTLAVDLVVPTEYGNIQGAISYSDAGPPVRVWRGVPFAAPPVGNLRFASPAPPTPWKPATLDCTAEKSVCPQLASLGGIVIGSEDCLYLDIYAPPMANSTSKLPVMVWIYGGGYVFGDNRELGLYDATNIVNAHNYVHVAMNYRLSTLGFLALPGLQAESAHHSTGNMALHDQQAALRFVQKNIAAFGGDPNQVTIFGESAGAFSVCWHLVSQTSKGLFKAAIMESGNCESIAFFYPTSSSFTWGKEYAEAVGCDSATHNDKELVECLRALPLAKVLDGGVALTEKIQKSAKGPGASWHPQLYPFMPWGPSIDKSPYGLLDTPWNLIKAGKYHHVPVILGTNANEGNLFIPGLPFIVPGAWFPLSEARVKLALHHFFNSTVTDNVVTMYYNSASTWESVVAVILRDFFFACPARRVAKTLSASVPTWLYHFTYVAPTWVDQWLLGDYHSSELEFVFNNPWPPLVHHFTENDKKMAATFGGYWTNLAYTGNPNSGPTRGLLTWPQYSTATSIMNMKVPTAVDNTYLDNICVFWDTVDPL